MPKTCSNLPYRTPQKTDGLVKIVTVFGIRFAAPHDWEQKGSVVTLAEGERDTRAMNRCYVVGIWPQPRSEVAKKRRLVLRRGR